jgi:hypothetical protein
MPSLLDWTQAEVAYEKFEAYSMDPANEKSNGKWMAFEALGYSVHDRIARRAGAENVVTQLRATLPPTPPPPISRITDYGDRYETTHDICGPNGRRGTLFAVWQVSESSPAPRLVTNWLEVHKT